SPVATSPPPAFAGPGRDQAATPAGLLGLIHLRSSIMPGAASRISARQRAIASSRQSVSGTAPFRVASLASSAADRGEPRPFVVFAIDMIVSLQRVQRQSAPGEEPGDRGGNEP